jgi:four helix bundle protein
MTYQRFEDLPVWKEAARLYEQTDDFLDAAPTRMSHSFRDQLERAVLSVSNNIAEGFERGTTNELLAFIYIARGSSGEVRSMLLVARNRPWTKDFRSQISNLILLAENCSRQLHGWAESLQNSPIEGQRRLNDRTRHDYTQKQRAQETQRRLLRNLPVNHPLRKDAEERGIL